MTEAFTRTQKKWMASHPDATEAEYERKLNIETHIDEAVEVSIGKGTRRPDAKNHDFAKDSWDYRIGYFEDFDGTYYSFKTSVGVNGKKNTVYNVNDVKKRNRPY